MSVVPISFGTWCRFCLDTAIVYAITSLRSNRTSFLSPYCTKGHGNSGALLPPEEQLLGQCPAGFQPGAAGGGSK